MTAVATGSGSTVGIVSGLIFVVGIRWVSRSVVGSGSITTVGVGAGSGSGMVIDAVFTWMLAME